MVNLNPRPFLTSALPCDMGALNAQPWCEHTPGTEGKGGASGDEDLAHHLEFETLETLEVEGGLYVFFLNDFSPNRFTCGVLS